MEGKALKYTPKPRWITITGRRDPSAGIGAGIPPSMGLGKYVRLSRHLQHLCDAQCSFSNKIAEELVPQVNEIHSVRTEGLLGYDAGHVVVCIDGGDGRIAYFKL